MSPHAVVHDPLLPTNLNLASIVRALEMGRTVEVRWGEEPSATEAPYLQVWLTPCWTVGGLTSSIHNPEQWLFVTRFHYLPTMDIHSGFVQASLYLTALDLADFGRPSEAVFLSTFISEIWRQLELPRIPL